jgi:hypothetical protein
VALFSGMKKQQEKVKVETRKENAYTIVQAQPTNYHRVQCIKHFKARRLEHSAVAWRLGALKSSQRIGQRRAAYQWLPTA